MDSRPFQVTFFVNTVISKQAVMKFHGVGDPTKTPQEATALEMGRGRPFFPFSSHFKT